MSLMNLLSWRRTALMLICALQTTASYSLTVTSLNIEWFGLGGKQSGTESDEFRDQHIKDFLMNAIPRSDVFVFQEIIDPYRIQSLFPDMTCSSYLTNNKRHQHVVACADNKLRLQAEVLKSVSLGNLFLRPALKITVQDEKGQFFNVIGVHLKAGYEDSQTRFEQLDEVKKHLDPNERFVVIGDWNAYPSSRTGLAFDDEYYFAEIFRAWNLERFKFSQATYIYKNQERFFDQAWSNYSSIDGKVYGPCAPENTVAPYQDRTFYNQNVSDHCAIQIEVEF